MPAALVWLHLQRLRRAAHRLRAFEEAMEHICGHAGVWKTTGREIARHYLDHHYDAALESMAAVAAEDAA